MKKSISLIALAFTLIAFVVPGEHSNLKLGDKAPNADQGMRAVSGQNLSLQDMKKDAGLLVVFSCNTCPFVVGNGEKTDGWEGRYNELAGLADQAGIGMVLVNSNEAKRDAGDNFDDMMTHSKTEGYKAEYVLDDNHKLADAFGAKRTPHVFLFDGDLTLAYQGAIDDNVDRASEVKSTYLMDAIKSLSAGTEIKVKETPPVGCSIKRVKQ